MSKNLLLCYYTIGGTSYYQDLAEEFVSQGNRVLHWNLYLSGLTDENKNKIIEEIEVFKPNLIFSFNNVCPEEIIKNFEIPTLILDADNPEFFHNKEIINKYDFYFLGFQSNSKELYKKILGANITDKNYLFCPTATGFKKDPLKKQDINISFIGSNFYKNFLENRILTNEEIDKMLYLGREIKKNYYFSDPNTDPSLINYTKYFLAGQDRLRYLSVLCDLGLEIYSNSDWRRLLTHDMELANCYKNETIITKNDNQEIYNRSKVSINLSHLQATNSFSWRVPDIMASNSCLIMEDKIDWHNMFGEYISETVKKSIIYKDQYDLREKCIKLLNDEDLRLRCVEECQNAIEKNGRWVYRLQKIESLIKIKILNNKFDSKDNSAEEKRVIVNNESEKQTIPPLTIFKEEEIIFYSPKKKPKPRIAIIFKCLLLAVFFIPFVGNKIVTKKKLQKILDIIPKTIDRMNNK